MSELDFQQKLDMRRAFWAMGASTRVDVKLSALVTPSAKSRTGAEEWTDLDVLGVQYVPLVGLVLALADCKTSRARVTERVFWLRGVADLFAARNAYLSRQGGIPPAARQLARRLGVVALDSDDRRLFLEQTGTARLPSSGSFLEGPSLRRWDALLLGAPDRIEKLRRYRRSFYWVFTAQRNLVQLPGYLHEVARDFDPHQRWAQALVTDLAWLYLVTVVQALDELTHLHLSELAQSLQQVMVGGELELRERQALLKALAEYTGKPGGSKSNFAVVPPWFDDLADLTARVSRRRSHATQALRILEFTGVETIANHGVAWAQAFPASDLLDAKLASDTIRFLTKATGISPLFVNSFDDAVAGQQGATAPGFLKCQEAHEHREGRAESVGEEPGPLFAAGIRGEDGPELEENSAPSLPAESAL